MAKNRYFIFIVLLITGNLVTSFQNDGIKVEESYLRETGKVEVPRGSNWGPDVKKYLASVNYKVPAPWCAAFVKYNFDQAGVKTTITAYSPTAHNSKNLVYYRGKLLKPLQPGDVFTIYFPKMGRIGHTGFSPRMINSSIVETFEGNSNDGGSRDGYGSFKRKRSLHTLYSVTRWVK